MKKYWLILSYVALAVFILVFLSTRFTFGFVPLFFLLGLFLAFPLIEKWLLGELYPSERAIVHVVLLTVFGVMSLWAFDNYVHPSATIFKNSDHHAIRVDGVELQTPGILLAADSRDAFFDESRYRGRLSIQSADSSGVILNLNAFSEPVYLVSGSKMHTYRMLNPDSFPSFQAGDTVHFYHRENGVERVTSMRIREHFRSYPWHFFFSRLFDHERDSLEYTFMSSDGLEQVSSESRFLLSGLPMSSILSDVVQDFDPQGIQIVRGAYDLDTKSQDVRSTYAENNRYYILVDRTAASISRIRINREWQNLNPRFSSDTIHYGQPFFIGFGKNKSKTMCFNWVDGRLRLEYYLPEYRYLSSGDEKADEQTLMITTSLFGRTGGHVSFESGLLDVYSENIALIDQFENADNVFQMQPWFLSFRSSSSGNPLAFTVYSDATYPARSSLDRYFLQLDGFARIPSRISGRSIPTEAYFPGVSATDRNVHWLVGAEDFTVTTPFTAKRMAMLILLTILLSVIAIIFGWMFSSLNNNLEYAVYLIIIAFLTIRCFLMWRMTVFPPVTSISYYEFNHFRDFSYYRILRRCLLAFFAFVFFFKLGLFELFEKGLYSSRRKGASKRKVAPIRKRRESSVKDALSSRPWLMALLILGVYIALFFVSPLPLPSSLIRLVKILLPVSVFLFFEFIVHKLYAKQYSDDQKLWKSRRVNIRERAVPILLSFLNVLLASAITFWNDGGYGVMFLLFSIYVCAFLIADLRYNVRGTRLVSICRVFLWAVVLLLPLVYKFLFVWLLDYRWYFVGGLFVFLCLVLLALSVVLEFSGDLKKHFVEALLVIAVISLAIPLAGGHFFMDGKHLEYRTRVHMASPSTILSEHISDNVSQNRFMQASLNDWILDEYETIGKDVHPFREKGEGYFKLQPQSKLGAMWFAQSTDIVLSRFIIAEHSELLAIGFIAAFLLLLLIALSQSCQRREYRIVLFSIPMLFLMQCTLILLANTRRFIFFGQDFPLLSTTSSFASLYFFFLFALLLAASYLEEYHLLGASRRQERVQPIIDKNNSRTNNQIRSLFVAPVLILLVFGGFFRGKNTDAGEVRERGVYSVDTLMARTSVVVDSLNILFRDYQNDHRLSLASDMSSQLAPFYDILNVPDSGFIALTRLSNEFAAGMLERFFLTDSHANSMRKLFHVRNERHYDTKGNPLDTLVFGLNSLYYYYRLPMNVRRAWTGNIVAQNDELQTGDPYQIAGADEFFRLRGEWIPDGEPRALVRTGSSLRLVGASSLIDISPSSLPVGVISSEDWMVRGHSTISTDVIEHSDVFARNVMVNGERTFLYPYGTELFWMREFANQIKLAKESNPNSDEGFNDDVPISLDGDLAHRIYQIYRTDGASRDRTVVVADGTGKVRAMVDYRSEEDYRLNPNDSKHIYAILEELSLLGLEGSPREQRLFGTFATSPLRLGPGSSQKPIVWTAVSSGYGGQNGFWTGLSIHQMATQYVSNPPRYPRFAGQPIEKQFQSIWDDEGSGGRNITLDWYIYKSSNYYNGLMAYFGMFTPEQIDAMWDDGLFRSVGRADYRSEARYFNVFPEMHVPGKPGTVAFHYFVTEQDYLNHEALLPYGLSTNFGLPTTAWRTMGLYPSIPRYVKNKKGKILVKSSAFTNSSFFNMDIRAGRTGVRQRNEYGVRSVAIGSNSVWAVSPVKMAEMFGRLVTLNQNYTLTLDPAFSTEYEPFEVDPAWHGAYQTSRRPFIQGLSRVFRSEDGGTAGDVYSATVERVPEGLQPLGVVIDRNGGGEGRYYVYGKTGTIDGKWDRKHAEDHMLAVVITNTRISTADDLRNVRFYVVYLADFGKTNWKPVDRRVLMQVIQSDDFVRYMNN